MLEDEFKEDFSSELSNDDNAAEDFGPLSDSSSDAPQKATISHSNKRAEGIEKSVEQLAAAVAVTKSIQNITPSPDLSIPTTSRRTVDIESLIASRNKNGGSTSETNKSKSNGSTTKRRKNNRRQKNKGGCLIYFCFLITAINRYKYVFMYNVSNDAGLKFY